MMTIRNLLWGGLTLLILTACQAPTTPSPAQPTPSILHAHLSPALPHIESALTACVEKKSNAEIIIHQGPTRRPDLKGMDISFWWGAPHQYERLTAGEYTIYHLGEMEISPAVHNDLPLDTLSSSNLSAIFKGYIQNWSALSPEVSDQPIILGSYPEDHPLRDVFNSAVLNYADPSPNAIIVPNTEAMEEFILGQPGTIGILPSDMISYPLKKLNISPPLERLIQPVLGFAPPEKPDDVSFLIACMENAFTP